MNSEMPTRRKKDCEQFHNKKPAVGSGGLINQDRDSIKGAEDYVHL